MKKTLWIISLLSLLFLIASCTTFVVAGVHMNASTPSYTSVGEFKTSVWVNEFLGASGGANLFNATSDAMDKEIFDAIKREIDKFGGDAAVNIKITYKAEFVQILFNGLTFGIWAPATAEISGTIVKYN